MGTEQTLNPSCLHYFVHLINQLHGVESLRSWQSLITLLKFLTYYETCLLPCTEEPTIVSSSARRIHVFKINLNIVLSNFHSSSWSVYMVCQKCKIYISSLLLLHPGLLGCDASLNKLFPDISEEPLWKPILHTSIALFFVSYIYKSTFKKKIVLLRDKLFSIVCY